MMSQLATVEYIHENEVEVVENDYERKELTTFGNDEIVTRANAYINAKSSTTLTENKIFALATKRAEYTEAGHLSFQISATELRALMNVKGNGFYDALKSAANSMSSRSIFIENKSKKEFKFINILTSATFKDGVFTINFNPEMNTFIRDLTEKYTSMKLSTLFSFKSIYSFRLFENLKIHGFKIPKDNSPVSIEYGLSELKLLLNLVDTEDKNIKLELQKKNPNYDRIVCELSENEPFADWYSFKKRVIEKAISEINEKTELYVQYKTFRHGRGGKVVKVIFFIQRNDEALKPIDLTTKKNPKKKDLPTKVLELLKDVPLKKKDAKLLLKVAENDIERIKNAYELSKKQSHIKNFMGWMTECIRDGYNEGIQMLNGSVEKAKEMNEKMEEYKKADKEEIASSLWDKVKNKDIVFPFFESYIFEEFGMDTDYFEEIYPATERYKMFVNWKIDYKKEK